MSESRHMLTISATLMALAIPFACTAREADHMNKSTTAHKFTNRLIDENSPYLLSHAHNPVDWYSWGDEALTRAREENKPIFLSIGYAACHWCHVMERESFENEEIAQILNDNYIAIKVDREQRPDLDQIYMGFTTVMTGHGGWPMSVFMTPELKPFFAGTYFPPDDRYGRPGFRRLITEIARVYKEEPDKIAASSEEVFTQMSLRLNQHAAPTDLSAGAIGKAARLLSNNFDKVNGGFGGQPKFPHTSELSLFLRHAQKSGDQQYLHMAEQALVAMARGGIYDHVGGGFARYSTDAGWLVPHFEKMLYDNALLVPVYVDAYQLGGNADHLETVRGTLDFLLREMTHQSGGFYSALDADSEGEEGKFYVWSKQEIVNLLGDDAELFCRYYNVTSNGNFEGHNILNLTANSAKLRLDSNQTDFDARMSAGLKTLLAERTTRIRPITDDKILTSWNGLALSALCRGYRATGEERYLEAAIKNATFVREELYRDGQLTHAWREGKHTTGQFLEDYGYYLPGLLDLYQTDLTDNHRWLAFAQELGDRAIDLFMTDDGNLYLRDADQEDLIFRPKEAADAARPAPGSFLIEALLKLGRLTGEKRFTDAGERGLQAISSLIANRPQNMTSALRAVDYHLGDKIEIVIVGETSSRSSMVAELNKRYLPNAMLAVSNDGTENFPVFEGRAVGDGKVMAYVCRNSACLLPVSTVEDLAKQLETLKP